MSWTVVGQDRAIGILDAAVKGGRVAHAYLFAGPAHVGKTLAARQFAQMLNCTGDEPPCGDCRSCRKIATGAHPDVELITLGGLCSERDHDHSKDNSRDIRICQIWRLQEVMSRAPYEGRHRIFIIEPAEAMNRDAVAALLKTLEEPPPYVVFVLVSDHEDMLLDTIRSRSRRVPFAGQPRPLIEQVLRTRWGAEPEQASMLARLAGGRLGFAIAALADAKLLPKRDEELDRCEAAAQGGLAMRFGVASSIGTGYTRDRAGTQATLELWQEWWRDLLLVIAGREERITNTERLDTLRTLAAQCDLAGAARALRALTDARQQLAENASPVLTLEAMVLALPVLRPNAVITRLRG
jgi:DNA polymerase-3 subunit delta'